MLVFENGVDFQKAMTSIQDNKLTIESRLFKSRVCALNEQNAKLKSGVIDENEYVTDEDSLVPSDALCNILNEKYELQIGDVVFKITPYGTVFTSSINSFLLENLILDEKLIGNCTKIATALGIFDDKNMYSLNSVDGVYLFDTFKFISGQNNQPEILVSSLKSTSNPTDADFIVFNDNKTWVGQGVSSIIGFSKGDWRRFNDRKYCVDVKFYSLDFGFYSEAGIKTKVQKHNSPLDFKRQFCRIPIVL